MTLPAELGGSREFTARPKLGHEVTSYLRDAIMAGEFRAGSRLRVEELASLLNISTMPVREALTGLAAEGLVVSLPRRGYRVATLTRSDVEDVFTIHAMVAGLLAERSVATITDENLRHLQRLQDEAVKVAERRSRPNLRASQVEHLNYEFHRTINTSCDAPRLRWHLRAAARYVPRRFYQYIPAWVTTTIDDHPAIIEALSIREGVRARSLMEAHIARAGKLVLEHLEASGLWR